VNIRPYGPAALIAGLIFYFGINALTGDRGLLTHARRNAVLAQREHELAALRRRHADLAARIKLMSETNLSKDYLEERAQNLLGYSDPRDYVIRRAN
jgi:cell division protein FtsB